MNAEHDLVQGKASRVSESPATLWPEDEKAPGLCDLLIEVLVESLERAAREGGGEELVFHGGEGADLFETCLYLFARPAIHYRLYQLLALARRIGYVPASFAEGIPVPGEPCFWRSMPLAYHQWRPRRVQRESPRTDVPRPSAIVRQETSTLLPVVMSTPPGSGDTWFRALPVGTVIEPDEAMIELRLDVDCIQGADAPTAGVAPTLPASGE